MMVEQIPVGPMANFVYLVMDGGSKEAMLIDSGWEDGSILKAVETAGAKVRFAAATHGHFDHVSTIGEVAHRLGARVVAHESSAIECDLRVRAGDKLSLGENDVHVLHTPGHTMDSICLVAGGMVFTGDTLFVGTIGRFEKENVKAMYKSLYEVILGLPSTTEMYPGHDYGDVPHRNLGEERTNNPYLRARDFRDFESLFG